MILIILIIIISTTDIEVRNVYIKIYTDIAHFIYTIHIYVSH